MGLDNSASWGSLQQVNKLNLIGQVFRVVAVLLGNIIIVRALNHSEFRDYSWIGAISIFVQTLFTLGFDQSFSYFFPKFMIHGERHKVKELLSFAIKTTFFFALISSSIILIGGGLLLDHGGEERLLPLLAVTVLANCFFAFSQIPLGALRALHHFRPAIINEQFLLPGLPLAFVILVSFFNANPLTIVSVQAVAFFIVLLSSALGLFGTLKKEGLLTEALANLKKSDTRTWLYYSVPISLMLTAECVFNWIVLSVSGLKLGDFETSFVGIALRSVQFFTFLTMALAPLMMPKISHFKHQDQHKELGEIVNKMAFWMGCWSLIIGFGLGVNRSLVLALFGQDFSLASGLLLWLLPGAIIEGALGFLKHASLSVGQNRSGLVIYTVASVLTAALTYSLSSSMGVSGALMAGSLGMIFVNVVRTTLFLLKNRLWLLRYEDFKKMIILLFGILAVWFLIEFLFDQQQMWLRLTTSLILSLPFLALAFWRDRDILFQLRGKT